MDDQDDDFDDLTEAEEDAWCAERREEVADYLQRENLRHGEIGDWPAWHIAPYVSVWAVESLVAPGSVGWWAICGDLPCDYCSSSGGCDNPRRALRRIGETWLEALEATPPGAQTIGETGLPADMTDLFRSRAELLLEWVADPDAWPPDAPDSDSSMSLH